MARKNRVAIPDGIYHVTSRICNKAMLFKPDEVKEKIQKWMFDIASFSGVELFAWCIMDNHLHLLVHVPRVPERLWTDPYKEPVSWAFGMRPPECHPPLWIDDYMRSESSFSQGSYPHLQLCSGNDGGGEQMEGIGVTNSICAPSRPAVGFMLDDEEMLGRLAHLYSNEVAEEIGARWRMLRAKQRESEVDAEKEKFCRRMYNISQFVKTLKERISMRYNAEFKHEGCLWQGRFYSGVVEDSTEVLSVVAGYIDYNPVKAGLVKTPENWKFSSWSVALGSGRDAVYCRNMYSKMLGCEWLDARIVMSSVLNDELPDGVTPKDVKEYYDKYEETHVEAVNDVAISNYGRNVLEVHKLRASQAIRCGMWFFKHGGYIGRTMDFAWGVVRHLPGGFPHSGFVSIKRCRAFEWVSRVSDGRSVVLVA